MSPTEPSAIQFTLKVSSRARYMKMAMHFDRGLVVTVPKFATRAHIDRFIRSNSAWISRKFEYIRRFDGKTILKGSKKDYEIHKESARKFVNERVVHFNRLYGFKYSSIFIKNQRSRWGSCSRSRNMNFNYKIIKLPLSIADYIVVHELCHLAELNHSRAFWNLVAKAVPNYRELRLELRKNYVTFQ